MVYGIYSIHMYMGHTYILYIYIRVCSRYSLVCYEYKYD